MFWNIATGDDLFVIKDSDAVTWNFDLSPNGKWIAVTRSSNMVDVWNVESRSKEFSFGVPENKGEKFTAHFTWSSNSLVIKTPKNILLQTITLPSVLAFFALRFIELKSGERKKFLANLPIPVSEFLPIVLPEDNSTWLHYFTKEKNANTVSILIEAAILAFSADDQIILPIILDNNGNSPFYYALKNKDRLMIKDLIDYMVATRVTHLFSRFYEHLLPLLLKYEDIETLPTFLDLHFISPFKFKGKAIPNLASFYNTDLKAVGTDKLWMTDYSELTGKETKNLHLATVKVFNVMNILDLKSSFLFNLCSVRRPEMMNTLFVRAFLSYKWSKFGKRSYII
jgi:hypothetical protein